MSKESFMQFLRASRDNPAMLVCYNRRNLSQLLFHAKNEGFDFTVQDVAQVVGMLEANVILALDQDPFNESSRLWRAMWGRTHFEYLIHDVVRRHTDEELQALIAAHESESRAPTSSESATPADTQAGPAVMPSVNGNVIAFLCTVAGRADVLDSLKVRPKNEVLAAAAAFGVPFSEPEFDASIWGLEACLAGIRGEAFDAQFSLWELMWGLYYLEYLVIDLMPCFEEAHADVVAMSHPGNSL